jgi:L-rhamnose isomerase
MQDIHLSLHCWQGDDVTGFENREGALTGGIAATGNYPGKARNADELREDLQQVFRLLPGKHRLNLHAIYAETGTQKIERNQIRPEHFSRWIDWGKEHCQGLDFNPTCFSHPKSADGFTLSHPDASIRQFWIEHCIASRIIGETFGRAFHTPSIVNIWIPDGYKDTPADRLAPRQRLLDSLDQILSHPISREYILDAVEPKLFGIGSESYVVGSMEFYAGYAIRQNILLTLDTGHFHPTESVADKISSLLLYLERILLHVSRGVRWDSDHVVIYNEELQGLMQEIIRANALQRVHIGLDYFDASINRIAAWVIGARTTLRALLNALLEPYPLLQQAEKEGNLTLRLALQEEFKTLPSQAVWEYYLLTQSVPVGISFMKEISTYEREKLFRRM